MQTRNTVLRNKLTALHYSLSISYIVLAPADRWQQVRRRTWERLGLTATSQSLPSWLNFLSARCRHLRHHSYASTPTRCCLSVSVACNTSLLKLEMMGRVPKWWSPGRKYWILTSFAAVLHVSKTHTAGMWDFKRPSSLILQWKGGERPVKLETLALSTSANRYCLLPIGVIINEWMNKWMN